MYERTHDAMVAAFELGQFHEKAGDTAGSRADGFSDAPQKTVFAARSEEAKAEEKSGPPSGSFLFQVPADAGPVVAVSEFTAEPRRRPPRRLSRSSSRRRSS